MQLWLSDQSAVAIRRVHAVVNPASGGVGPGAAEAMAELLSELGVEHSVSELTPETAEATVRRSVDAGPDLVVVLGGDGTARLVAELCGPTGPLVAPLSGGTMNKLGRALYAVKPWRQALTETLARGEPRWIAGGEIGGRGFYCGAVLGSPALMARAREAVRAHELGRAWRQAVLASKKALLSRLSYDLDGDVGRGVAVSFICPTVSRLPGAGGEALKAAVLAPPEGKIGAAAGVRWALGHLVRGWRHNPDMVVPCVRGRAWAKKPIPVMLDGEFFRVRREVEIRFRPRAFRALALPAQDASGPGLGFCS